MHLTASIRFGNLQDARRCVDVGQEWPGPGEDRVTFERGRFVAEAITGPTSRLQLLHGKPAWVNAVNPPNS